MLLYAIYHTIIIINIKEKTFTYIGILWFRGYDLLSEAAATMSIPCWLKLLKRDLDSSQVTKSASRQNDSRAAHTAAAVPTPWPNFPLVEATHRFETAIDQALCL